MFAVETLADEGGGRCCGGRAIRTGCGGCVGRVDKIVRAGGNRGRGFAVKTVAARLPLCSDVDALLRPTRISSLPRSIGTFGLSSSAE